MAALVFRIALVAAGLGVAEIGLTSLAVGLDIGVIQLLVAAVLLVAGTAGFFLPLLGGRMGKEPQHD